MLVEFFLQIEIHWRNNKGNPVMKWRDYPYYFVRESFMGAQTWSDHLNV